ncbi:phage tail spike protein [Clostridium sp. 'White wine YQ']|uniref:phage tail spike protein n=1 Tax=Clostridium sp. 'White wine YQ' TaxID=3027474 RepID=UPI0023663150|nr:phage tail spike protein [Clostridium sp. 'White wine YQ']MDD7793703.1 phage tail protein [Clostridium sp. 'White wine YQ']
MLQLYDLNKVKIAGLKNYKDLKVERDLSGDEVLSFLYPQNDFKYDSIKEECYIRTKKNEYVIKEVNVDNDWTGFVGKVNVESLKGTTIQHFEAVEQTCTNSVNLALAGTGWTIGSCDVTKKRTIRKANCSSYDILQEIRKVYRCDFKFDAINKKIYIYKLMGTDRGSYFSESLNIKKLGVQSSSYDFVTRLIPIGKNGLKITSVNGGKEYVENYQYSTKVITIYWEDNRYTDAQSLLEDATAKLDELSKPIRAYSAEIFDLANLNDKYSNILDYDLGDTITLLSKDKKVKEKQRIVKIIEYPDEPERNSCDIANKSLSFEDIQAENQAIIDSADNVITSDGGLDGSKVDGIDWNKLQNVHIMIADIQDMSVVTARIGTLENTTAHITNGNIDNANIDVAHVNRLYDNYAHIVNGVIDNAQVDTANIKTGAIGTAQIQYGAITQALIANSAVGSEQVADSSIGNAKIIDLDVAKLLAGDISTNKFTVVSDSGNLKIQGNTLHVWDTTGKERISLGLNGTDYNLTVRAADGTTVMFGANGVTNAGITSGAVDDSKVAANANINGSKIEKESLVASINGATTTLKASKVKLDTENQTLDIAFSSLKSTVTTTANTVSSQGTSISTIQGQISSKIWSTDITTAVNNLQVGGRNLLKKSSIGGTQTADYYGGNNAYYKNISTSTWRIQGFTSHDIGNYSLGFWAKATTAGVLTVDICDQFSTAFNVTTEWQYFKLENKYITSVYLNQTYFGFIDFSGVSLGTLYLGNVKLEKGSKCSDWDLAPEDVQGQIDSINTNITTNYSTTTQTTTLINTAVSSVTTELHTNYSTTTAMNTAISQSASGVLSTVSSTYATKNDLTGKVDLSTYNSYVSQTATAISSKVSSSDYTGNTIASLINQSATTIKLSASKIDLSGYVTISALGTAGLTVINGSNITTGTISANRISGGTISGVNINVVTDVKIGNNLYLRGGNAENTLGGSIYFGTGFTDGARIYAIAAYDVPAPGAAEVHYVSGGGGAGWHVFHGDIFIGGLISAGQQILNGRDTWLRTYGQTGWYNGTYDGGMYMIDSTWVRTYSNKGLASPSAAHDRVQGFSNAEISYFGSGSCGVDMTSGDARWRKDAYNYILQAAGGVYIYSGGVNRHTFNSNGTKSGGSIEIDEINYGLSPIDSPKVLIEDVLFDVEVNEEGTLIELDERLTKALYQYAVFPSSGKVEVVEKNKKNFKVIGYSGRVDFKIIGTRIDSTEVDWLVLY